MPRNGSGIYSPPTGTFGVAGEVISSSAYDTFVGDIGAEITNSVNVQGTAPMLAPLNMGTFRGINAGAPIAPTDLVIKSYVDTSIPAGMLAAFPLDDGTIPQANGWIECQGYSLSTTTYANLFAAIGYTFGGSGANFTIPDFRGCFLRGFDSGRGLDFQGSRAAGVFQNSYLINHFHSVGDPSHTHGASTGSHNHTINDPSHNHTVPNGQETGPGNLAGGTAFALNFCSTSLAFTGITINGVGNIGVTVNNAFTGITVNGVTTGNVNFGAETTVVNYPILWCIKF